MHWNPWLQEYFITGRDNVNWDTVLSPLGQFLCIYSLQEAAKQHSVTHWYPRSTHTLVLQSWLISIQTYFIGLILLKAPITIRGKKKKRQTVKPHLPAVHTSSLRLTQSKAIIPPPPTPNVLPYSTEHMKASLDSISYWPSHFYASF